MATDVRAGARLVEIEARPRRVGVAECRPLQIERLERNPMPLQRGKQRNLPLRVFMENDEIGAGDHDAREYSLAHARVTADAHLLSAAAGGARSFRALVRRSAKREGGPVLSRRLAPDRSATECARRLRSGRRRDARGGHQR